MKKLTIFLILLFMPACASVPTDKKSASTSSVPFKTLIENPDPYIGTTVKLGGYILKTKNLTDKTTIDVLQTPLTGIFQKQPKTKEYSEGRYTVVHEGFLDPAEYSKDRPITVTGTFMGCKDGKGENCLVEASHIRLWAEVDPRRRSATYAGAQNPFNDPDYFKKGVGGFP